MKGCTKIAAVNFNPSATEHDYSCLYTYNVDGKCLLFREIQPDKFRDVSFTASMSVRSDVMNWVFFHDYLPDFYIQTRDGFYSMKDNNVYEHNVDGVYGKFYGIETKPFFIDIVYSMREVEFILSVISWMTSIAEDERDNSERDSLPQRQTLTHISIWNSTQHTGRIAIEDIFDKLEYENHRKVGGKWSMNNFRDIVKEKGSQFLDSIFKDFSLKPGTTEEKVWYEQERLQDTHFVIRFEFDNLEQKQLILHETEVSGSKTER